MYDVIVAGAGASGMVAAARAAELGARVLIAEKNERPGKKLLITGKGRCNITNSAGFNDFLKQIHPNGRFMKTAFGHFFSDDMIKTLEGLGVHCVLERGGRYFPESGKSSDVLEALIRWMQTGMVDICYNSRVVSTIVSNDECHGLRIVSEKTMTKFPSKTVIIATGGKSYPATGSTGDGYNIARSLGHTIVPVRPSLVPLITAGTVAQRMQGLSLKNVEASLWVNDKKLGKEFGEMLFTHFGLSGPIILSLSRLATEAISRKDAVKITIDLKPALTDAQLDARLLRDIDNHGKKRMTNLFKDWLPAAMIPVFMDENNIDHATVANQLGANERKRIATMMKNLTFQITGQRSFTEAIITAGGIDTKEVHSKSMESRLIKNLFFCGELLNLDANTGGYNLQIAWSSGYLAGQSAALRAAEMRTGNEISDSNRH